MASMLRAYEEVQAFFEDLQDEKETKANAFFQKEYDRQRKEIEDFINGELKSTETRIRMILGELNLPFRVEASCQYDEVQGLLISDIVIPKDLGIPTNKTNLLSTGKVSVKRETFKRDRTIQK